jgi:hypothetical protein
MERRVRAFAALAAVAATVAWVSAQQLTRRDADSLERKLSAVLARGAAKPAPRQSPVRTSFSERELNAYLKFSAHEQLPKGVVDPEVNLAGDRRISGHAVVDLDVVRTSKERSWFDPAAYLTGSVDLHASGLLQTANGRGTFQLESATVGGVSIPKSLFQELVTYYSRSPDLPNGFDLDKPFDLPAHIREVEIQRGGATVVQ